MSNRLFALAIAQLTICFVQVPAQAADANDDASHHRLSTPKPQKVKLRATSALAGDEQVISLRVTNKGRSAALALQLTLVDGKGHPLAPARFSDNEITLRPGEPRTIEIRYPAALGNVAIVTARGWNAESSAATAGYVYLPPYYQQTVTTPARTAVSATSTVTPRH